MITHGEADAGPSLLIFSDDWGRHPSSCQHLAKVLRENYQIYWVNTIGTRPPRFDRATVRRVFEKVRQWLQRPDLRREVGNPTVLNPWMWPYFRSSFDRRLNQMLLRRQLAPTLRASPTPVVAITTIPIVADLVGVLPVDRWIYYCPDDYSEWPGLDQVALQTMEGHLVHQVDAVIAVSAELERKFAAMGRQAEVVSHGTDLAHWARLDQSPAEAILARLPEPPLIIFWGVIDRRLDVAWLRRLGEDLDQGTIVLVGPEIEPDPALDQVSRLVRIGPVSYEDLPTIAEAARVLIMPYADLAVTRAMQPLKLKEYIATAKPVIVRDLPATRCWSDALDLAGTPEAFSEAVRRRLDGLVPLSQMESRKRLKGETWAAKAREFERLAIGRMRS